MRSAPTSLIGSKMPRPLVARPLAKLNAAVAGLGILFVVYGHSLVASGIERDRLLAENTLYRFLGGSLFSWIYTFHMPLFFFLSGWNYQQFSRLKGRTFRQVIHDKALRLLVPYLSISSIAFLIKVGLSRFAMRPVQFSWSSFLHQIAVPWENSIIYFWFLPTLFLMFVAVPLFNFFHQSGFRKIIGLLICLCGYLSFPHQAGDDDVLKWLNLSGVLHHSLFFFAGMVLQRDLSNFSRQTSLLLAVTCLTGSLLVFAKIQEKPAVIQLLLAILGIASCWWACLTVEKSDMMLTFFGRYSFQIYLLSWFPQIAVRILLFQVMHLPIVPLVGLSFLVGGIAPILVTLVLDRIVPRRMAYFYGR